MFSAIVFAILSLSALAAVAAGFIDSSVIIDAIDSCIFGGLADWMGALRDADILLPILSL